MSVVSAAAVIVVVVLFVLTGGLVSFNRFVRQRNTIEESWRQIDVELQRRHDLVPNLVEIVRASAAFEQATLRQVMDARTAAMTARQDPASGHRRQSIAEGELSGALRGFFGLAENYPNLRSSANFLHLQRQFADTEDRLAAGRRFYNGNVRAYNTRRRTIPSNVVAGTCRFRAAEYFELDDPSVRSAPRLAGAFESLTRQELPTSHDEA
ncbi:MAG: LemA family protein [Stackebrandtia sp.]